MRGEGVWRNDQSRQLHRRDTWRDGHVLKRYISKKGGKKGEEKKGGGKKKRENGRNFSLNRLISLFQSI